MTGYKGHGQYYSCLVFIIRDWGGFFVLFYLAAYYFTILSIFVPKLSVYDTRPQNCQKTLAKAALSFPTATVREVFRVC